jgi:hypothetical protein
MANKKQQLKFTSLDGTVKYMSLDEGRDFLFKGSRPMVVEDELVRTYEELLAFAAREENRNKEFLEVKYLELVDGG